MAPEADADAGPWDEAEVPGQEAAGGGAETAPAAEAGTAPVADDAFEEDASERTGEIIVLLSAGEDEADRTGEIVLLAPAAGAVTAVTGANPELRASAHEETLALRAAVDPWSGSEDSDVTLHLAVPLKASAPRAEIAAVPASHPEAAARAVLQPETAAGSAPHAEAAAIPASPAGAAASAVPDPEAAAGSTSHAEAAASAVRHPETDAGAASHAGAAAGPDSHGETAGTPAAHPETSVTTHPHPGIAAGAAPRPESPAAPAGSPDSDPGSHPAADPHAAVTRVTGSYPVLSGARPPVRPEVVNEVSGGYPVINSSLTGGSGAYLSLNGNAAAYAALNRASGAYPAVPDPDERAVGAARVVGPPRRFVGSAQPEISAEQAPRRRSDVWVAVLLVAVAAVVILGVAYAIAVS
ncbi:hypothetical protein [Catenuloplanes indicus]|uniref:Uncharacterized protein n=1 Tax=Catenuloplanes indicus TaxID=137267 RepID=A0AAE3W5P2_9ACTN|nr:hypothetical protein [Catenuloplanes indicus]MDQ0369770.1 hypothetical protein [Catenuloplanes indicus]